MDTFTSSLKIEVSTRGKRKFTVFVPFRYHVGGYPSTEVIEVPVGFKTDFASIPRIFWPILSPIEEYAKAAVLHDWLYFKGTYSRKRTEEIFNEAMKVLDTPKWKRIIVYSFVKAFGWRVWNKYRKNDK